MRKFREAVFLKIISTSDLQSKIIIQRLTLDKSTIFMVEFWLNSKFIFDSCHNMLSSRQPLLKNLYTQKSMEFNFTLRVYNVHFTFGG